MRMFQPWKPMVACLVVGSILGVAAYPAQAQILDRLKGAAGMGQGADAPQAHSSGGGLGGTLGGAMGGGMPSVGSASGGNLAGVLQYCIRNNYLGGGGASTTESGLLGKLGGGTSRSSQFESGDRGELQTGQGSTFSLGGGGLKSKITQKVCDQILKHARSMI